MPTHTNTESERRMKQERMGSMCGNLVVSGHFHRRSAILGTCRCLALPNFAAPDPLMAFLPRPGHLDTRS